MSQKISYSQLVSIVLKQINKFRQNPQSLIPILEKRKSKYQDNYYLYGGGSNIKVATQQGVQPVDQAILQLSRCQMLPLFKWSFQLHCAANKRANYLARSQDQDHKQINLATLDDVLPQGFQYTGEVSEHFAYGFCDPIDIITNFLIDDGHRLRQNRQSLLNKDLNHIGIGIEHHPKYMFIVVLIMVSRTQRKAEAALQRAPLQPFSQFQQQQMKNRQQQIMKQRGLGQNTENIVFQKSASDSKCKSCQIF